MVDFAHALDADEFSVDIELPKFEFFLTLDQVAMILGVSDSWVRAHMVNVSAGRPSDTWKLRVVDLSPDEGRRTYRVGESELRRFLQVRRIPYKTSR